MNPVNQLRPFVGVFLFMGIIGCQKSSSRVVVACAQDREFAEGVFVDFEKTQGLNIAAKYDTEANKSVSLAAELLAEKSRPRCDVHWNNELIATIRLSRQGVYQEYQSPMGADYPAWSRGKHWQAFAARARVLIINTKLVPESDRPQSIFDLTQPKWKGQVAMAKPFFGTTATQAACLMQVLGADKAKQFYRDLKANDLQIVAGNKQVAVGVAEGQFKVGFTDSDDALIELERKKEVAVIFPEPVLFIPNSLALIANGPNPMGGKLLIDRLLSAEVEAKLAEAGGYQIPLNPKCKAKLHLALKTPSQVKTMDVDWEKTTDLWDETQAFLKELF